jgi:hypothetical protein
MAHTNMPRYSGSVLLHNGRESKSIGINIAKQLSDLMPA